MTEPKIIFITITAKMQDAKYAYAIQGTSTAERIITAEVPLDSLGDDLFGKATLQKLLRAVGYDLMRQIEAKETEATK